MPTFVKGDERVSTNDPDLIRDLVVNRGFKPTEAITVVGQFGERTVSPEQAKDALSGQGVRAEMAAERGERTREARKEEEFGGAGGALQALGAGALRTLSLGLSDPLLQELGVDRRTLRALQEVQPGATAAGELGALFIPGIGTAGSGAIARAARFTPAGAVGKLARSLGRKAGAAALTAERAALVSRGTVAAETIGEAGALATRVPTAGLAVSAVGPGVTGLVEGTAYGAGAGLSAAVLSDKPLTAEALVSQIGSGALFGGAVGGVAGGLLGVGTAALGRRSAASMADDLAAGNPALDFTSAEGRQAAARAREVAGHVDDLSQTARARAATALDSGAVTGDQANIVRGLARQVERDAAAFGKLAPHGLTDDVIETVVVKGGDKGFKRLVTAQRNLQRSTRQLMEALEEGSGKQLDDLIHGANATGIDSFDALDALAVADAMGLDVEDVPVVGDAADLLLKGRLLFRAPQLLGRTAGKTQRFTKLVSNAISRAAGINIARRSQVLSGLGETAVGATARDTVRGLQGAVAGATAKDLFDATFGVGARLGAEGGGVVSKLASAAEKFVKAANVVSQRTPSALAILSGVRFGGNEVPKVRKQRGEAKLHTTFRQREKELRQAMANPEATRAQIERRLAGIRQANLELAGHMSVTAMRKMAYLHSQLPPRPPTGSAATVDGMDRFRPSTLDIARFARQVNALEDPVDVIERFSSGQVTPEEVEAIRVVYPELFMKTQTFILQNLVELKHDLSYNKRVQLSILYRVPADTTMRPSFIATMQGQFQVQDQAGPGQAPPAPKTTRVKRVSPEVASQRATPTQRLESR